MNLAVTVFLALLAVIPPVEGYISNCGVDLLIDGDSTKAGDAAIILSTPQPTILYIPKRWPRGVRWEKWVDGEWTSVWPKWEFKPVWSGWDFIEFRTGDGPYGGKAYADVLCTNSEGVNVIPPGRYRYVLYFFVLDPRVMKTGLTQWCVARSEPFVRTKAIRVDTFDQDPDVYPPCESQ